MPSRPYPYTPQMYRAQCLTVIDGETAELFLDLGFREYTKQRLRLHGIRVLETGVNENDYSQSARETVAAAMLRDFLKPTQISGAVLVNGPWSLRVTSHEVGDDWTVDIWSWDDTLQQEFHINARMVEMGLAVVVD